MKSLAPVLFASSAAIVALLGALHLYYTLASEKFFPRDRDLKSRLEAVSPVISKDLSMWSAWVGFNISHSMGVLLFGLFYGYLALFRLTVLSGSPFLLILGAVTLLSYIVVARLYWFKVPFRGAALSFLLYLCGLATLVFAP